MHERSIYEILHKLLRFDTMVGARGILRDLVTRVGTYIWHGVYVGA